LNKVAEKPFAPDLQEFRELDKMTFSADAKEGKEEKAPKRETK